MKRFALLALVVVMLVTLSGVASADKPVDRTFTITSSTSDILDLNVLPNGLTSYHLLAKGNVSDSTGYFNGRQFTLEEWGIADFTTGNGNNHCILTVYAADSKLVAELRGIINLQGVTGKFDLQQKDGTGVYRGLDGHGDYTGNAASDFAVTFTGKFH